MKTVVLLAAALIALTAHADDRRRAEKRESHNYIIRRQQAYSVQGTPSSRLIIGKRQIDIYRNGLMFEGDNVVGIRANR
jgi:hypothetical protein